MSDRLAGKRAVVTGAGRGIGRAIALSYAREGARVAALGRTQSSLDSLAAEQPGILPVETDVTSETSIAAAFARVVAEFGGLDVLVTSAAVQLHGADARAHELSLEIWNQTIATNLTGVFLACKHAVRAMLDSGGGSIVNIGSPTGIAGSSSTYTAYSASKAGVHSLTRVLAIGYAADHIRANTLVPGATRGPLIEQLLEDEDATARLIATIPLGRLGLPEEYTGLAIHLASDESSYSTGGLFVADGGHTVR